MLSFSLGHSWKPATGWCMPRRPKAEHLGSPRAGQNDEGRAGRLGQSQSMRSVLHHLGRKTTNKENHRLIRLGRKNLEKKQTLTLSSTGQLRR